MGDGRYIGLRIGNDEQGAVEVGQGTGDRGQERRLFELLSCLILHAP